MHIPDAAISPATSIAAAAAMLPVWAVAGRRLRRTLDTANVPRLAIGAAFCFAVMLFNLPVPGGTTVHPVGGVLLAVLLGPEAAILGVTVALFIQALFFGDGGVFALGANCFTMAFVMPVCGYAVYKIVAGHSAMNSARRALAAAIGAYVGINLAALTVALILGLQPALFHEPGGRALYFPFGLNVTVPAMLLAHLLVAGVAEAGFTFLVVKYLQTAQIALYALGHDADRGERRSDRTGVILAALVALSPLGLLAKGDAWGEWSADEIAKRAGYAPKNFAATDANGWHGLNFFPDYLSERGPVFYLFAGAVGVALITILVLLIGKLLARREPPKSKTGTFVSELREGDVPGWMREPNPPAPFPCSFAAHRREGGVRFPFAARGGEANALPLLAKEGAGGRFRADYVAKTINGLAAAVQEGIFAEKWAQRDGLLQRIDARVKIVTLLGLLTLSTFLHRAEVLFALAGFAGICAAASHLTLGMFLRRVWLSVPLFVGAVALPAALNTVTPGAPLFVLVRHPYLAITAPGLEIAGILFLRAGVAVGFAVLLTLTTRWNELLYGLRVLGVPKIFLVVLAMTYRYLAVLMQSAQEVFLARQSRSVGSSNRAAEGAFLAGAVGGLFGKSLALTDDVHAAMRSRGWNGSPAQTTPPRLRGLDFAWLGGAACAVLLAWAGEFH